MHMYACNLNIYILWAHDQSGLPGDQDTPK